MMLRFILLFIISIGLPLLVLPLGLRFIKLSFFAEKKRFAYNSKRSTKNAKLWQFANYKLGRFWVYSGLILFILNLVLYLSFSKHLLNKELLNYLFVLISLLIFVIVILISIIYIEVLLIKQSKNKKR